MSYTLTQPSLTTHQYLPAENLTWFTVDSSNKNENSFNYTMVVQVTTVYENFIAGTTGSDVVGTFRIPPRPVTGEGKFSPNSVIKNYVTSTLDLGATGAAGITGDGIRKFQIKFGEEYVDGSGNVVSTSEDATSKIYFFWDSIVSTEDFPSYDMNNYVIRNVAAPTDGPLLTDGPNNRNILANDNVYALITQEDFPSHTLDKTDLFSVYYTFWTVGIFGYWNRYEFAGYTTAVSWEQTANGVRASSALASGEYSKVMYYPPSGTTPLGTGPITMGSVLNINLRTRHLYVNNDLYFDLRLIGKVAGSAVPVIFNNMIRYQGVGSELYYKVENLNIPVDLEWIGFATYHDPVGGPTTNPEIYEVSVWEQITTDVGVYWGYKETGEAMVEYPVNFLGKITYINVGTNGIASGADFDIALYDGADTRISERIYYSEATPCSNCDKVSLTWLNSLGGYDTYEFNCLSGKELEVSRVTGEISLPPDYAIGQRGRINPSNIAKKNKKVSTNWTTQTDVDWLESLFMSTDVYESQPNGDLIPVTINNSTYAQFLKQDKLKLVEFTYTIGYNRQAQIK